MKIVIDINDDLYTRLFDNGKIDAVDMLKACAAIRKGTPLPKGHGELVDIRPLMRGLYEEMCVGELTYTTSEVYKMLENETSTIIEADKKEREEDQ